MTNCLGVGVHQKNSEERDQQLRKIIGSFKSEIDKESQSDGSGLHLGSSHDKSILGHLKNYFESKALEKVRFIENHHNSSAEVLSSLGQQKSNKILKTKLKHLKWLSRSHKFLSQNLQTRFFESFKASEQFDLESQRLLSLATTESDASIVTSQSLGDIAHSKVLLSQNIVSIRILALLLKNNEQAWKAISNGDIQTTLNRAMQTL